MTLLRTTILALAFACALGAGARAAAPISGVPVLVTGTTPMQAYASESAAPGGKTHFDIWEVADGNTVGSYDVDMTKVAHLIVVTDDLRSFAHLHPVLHPNGHFTIDLALHGGLYHLYLDDLATGIGRTVFRFDVPIGKKMPMLRRVLHAAGNAVRIGPYLVTVDTTTLPAGAIATVHVAITKNGQPATDLHPYLGTEAHGVYIGVSDLAYMHAHGMSEDQFAMSSTSDCGDAMMMSMAPLAPNAKIGSKFVYQVLAPSAQTYDVWLQFIGGSTLYTAPLLMTAK